MVPVLLDCNFVFTTAEKRCKFQGLDSGDDRFVSFNSVKVFLRPP